jgi:hypothetical protein
VLQMPLRTLVARKKILCTRIKFLSPCSFDQVCSNYQIIHCLSHADFDSDYSLHLVTDENILAFFRACIPFMNYEHFKFVRSSLHDTHYRGESWIAGEGYEDEGDKEFIIATVTRVAAFTNDEVRPWFDSMRR